MQIDPTNEHASVPRDAPASRGASRDLTSANGLSGLLVHRVPIVAADHTVADVWSMMVGRQWDLTDIVVVAKRDGSIAGVIDARDLLAAEPGERAAALQRSWPLVDAGSTPERAALTAHRHNVSALPVIDANGGLLGCLRAETLMDVLWHEHAEDLHRFAGLQRETRGARRAFLFDSPLQRLRKRAPWLIAGAVGSALATSIMAEFEAVLAADLSVAFFIPAIVYLADAVGTQTEAIAVRGLTLEHRKFGHAVVREAATGLLIGILLGALAFVGVTLVFGAPKLAMAVGLALLAASSFSSVIGVVLPCLLDRLGLDPAFGAGPLATIVQDLASILLYLAAVTWLIL